MIICSCTRITDTEIRTAIAWMRAADPYTLITPGKIYRALGRKPSCGGCIRLFVARMRLDDNLAVRHHAVPAELCNLRAEPRQAQREEA